MARNVNAPGLSEDLLRHDPLLDCLLELTRIHGRPSTRAALSAGLATMCLIGTGFDCNISQTAPMGVIRPTKAWRSQKLPARFTPMVFPMLPDTAVTTGCSAVGRPRRAACETRSGSCEPEGGRLLMAPESSSRRCSSVKMAR